MITSDGIVRKEFGMAANGYNRREVDEVLDNMADRLDKLTETRSTLRRKLLSEGISLSSLPSNSDGDAGIVDNAVPVFSSESSGYNPKEVDEFILEIMADTRTLENQNSFMREKLRQCKEGIGDKRKTVNRKADTQLCLCPVCGISMSINDTVCRACGYVPNQKISGYYLQSEQSMVHPDGEYQYYAIRNDGTAEKDRPVRKENLSGIMDRGRKRIRFKYIAVLAIAFTALAIIIFGNTQTGGRQTHLSPAKYPEGRAQATAEPKAAAVSAKQSYSSGGNAGSSFTNQYGTRTTRCAHPGCDNYIASSGNTNCCTLHSRRCLECGSYIDEDAAYCMDCITKAAAGTKSTSSSGSGSSGSFSNAYGSAKTKCAHPGCNNPIASSGDTNCCTAHSKRCLECGKYIDEDALYCMSCLSKALQPSGGKSSGSSSSGSKSSGSSSSGGKSSGSFDFSGYSDSMSDAEFDAWLGSVLGDDY